MYPIKGCGCPMLVLLTYSYFIIEFSVQFLRTTNAISSLLFIIHLKTPSTPALHFDFIIL